MHQSWVVAAAEFSLYVYYVLVLALVGGIVLRRSLPRARVPLAPSPVAAKVPEHEAEGYSPIAIMSPPRAARLSGPLRFFVEYVGNLDLWMLDATEWDRRRNRQARILMEFLKEDLARRNIPAGEKDRIVEKMRESIQSAEPEQAG